MPQRVDTPSSPPPLDYQTAASRGNPPPSQMTALLLCLPGSICWFLLAFLAMYLKRSIGVAYFEEQAAVAVMCWPAAIVTAIASVVIYVQPEARPWRWYVWLNLSINVSGLLFSLGVAILAFR